MSKKTEYNMIDPASENTGREMLDYIQIRNKFWSLLSRKENSVMVLATSADNMVMARSVLVIHDEPDLYFFTWKHSRKYHQIEKNNRISLCRDKVEIEGIAEVVGGMKDEKNKDILEILRKKQPNAIESWENKPNMVIIRMKPLFACVDGYYIDDDAYLEYIDFTNQTAYREKWGYY